MDPARVTEAVTSPTRAVIVQHTLGIPAPVDRIRVDAPIIEDCGHVTPGVLVRASTRPDTTARAAGLLADLGPVAANA